MSLVFRMTFGPLAWKFSARYIYPLTTRRLGRQEMPFINMGYEEDPPMGLPLEPASEPNRASIQLYHRVAGQADIAGKQVLEVGCGHGGGAAYLANRFAPAAYTGIDLNSDGIEYCRGRHRDPRLIFCQGDAQHLPFADQSFDAVINIESSHCYPDFGGFLLEVNRVLRPGGRLLYADLRNRKQVEQWEATLATAPLTVVHSTDIAAEVERGFGETWKSDEMHAAFYRQWPALLRPAVRNHTGMPGSALRKGLRSGEIAYRMYDLRKG